MAVALTILHDSGAAPTRRTLSVAPGTTILKAAHASGVDVTATCGGRGRCTSCRVKFLAGLPPPPTIMDEVQLGADLVREGYRLSCQCVLQESVTVHVALVQTPAGRPAAPDDHGRGPARRRPRSRRLSPLLPVRPPGIRHRPGR